MSFVFHCHTVEPKSDRGTICYGTTVLAGLSPCPLCLGLWRRMRGWREAWSRDAGSTARKARRRSVCCSEAWRRTHLNQAALWKVTWVHFGTDAVCVWLMTSAQHGRDWEQCYVTALRGRKTSVPPHPSMIWPSLNPTYDWLSSVALPFQIVFWLDWSVFLVTSFSIWMQSLCVPVFVRANVCRWCVSLWVQSILCINVGSQRHIPN